MAKMSKFSCFAKNVVKVNEKFTIEFCGVLRVRSGRNFNGFGAVKNTFQKCKIRVLMVNKIYCAFLEQVVKKKSIGKINKNQLILFCLRKRNRRDGKFNLTKNW